MKIILVAAAFGLTASAAFAECAGHMPISAEMNVDRTIVTASVATDDNMSTSEELLLLRKGDRLPEQAKEAPVVD